MADDAAGVVGCRHHGHGGDLAAADEAVGRVVGRQSFRHVIADRIGLAVERDTVGNLEGDAFLAHRRHEAVAHVMGEGELGGRQDDEQPPTASSDQAFRGTIAKGVIVVIHVRMRRRKLGAAVAHEGKTLFHQEFHALVGGFGAAEQDAVGHPVADDMLDRIDLRRV